MKSTKKEQFFKLNQCNLSINTCNVGAVIFTSELLLNGIVIQKLEYARFATTLSQIQRL